MALTRWRLQVPLHSALWCNQLRGRQLFITITRCLPGCSLFLITVTVRSVLFIKLPSNLWLYDGMLALQLKVIQTTKGGGGSSSGRPPPLVPRCRLHCRVMYLPKIGPRFQTSCIRPCLVVYLCWSPRIQCGSTIEKIKNLDVCACPVTIVLLAD